MAVAFVDFSRIDFKKISTIILTDNLVMSPKKFGSFINEKLNFLSEEKRKVHGMIYDETKFSSLNISVQDTDIRYYSPSAKLDIFCRTKILSLKGDIQDVNSMDSTKQKECLNSFEKLITQVEGIQRIKNKAHTV